jgi:heat-inducible transcriptional repressor
MEVEKLTRGERDAIRRNLDPAVLETDDLLKETSRILGKISRQLCVVTSPHLSSGTLEKMELVSITSNKLLVILSIKSGLVRTIMMEVISEIPREKLEELVRLLNERLSGLSLADIRDTFVQRVEDVRDEDTGLIRLFIESVDKVFSGNKAERLHIAGAENMVQQPEFVSPENFRSVVELINNEEIIIHVLEKSETSPRQVRVAVGDENVDPMLKPYGVITSMYTVGDITGTVGMIGPKRMAYARMIPLVDYVAKTISELFASSYKSS